MPVLSGRTETSVVSNLNVLDLRIKILEKMMLLIFLVNQLTALNITEQKANYQKLLDTQELFIDFELGFVVSFLCPNRSGV